MSRHIEDCAQLLKYINIEDSNILDIGSGAGFPGIVMYIIKKDLNINFKLDIVEKSFKEMHFIYRSFCKFFRNRCGNT